MIKAVTLRPFAPFESKALVRDGLAIIAGLEGFWIYHVRSGLKFLGYPIVGAKNALKAFNELLDINVNWGNLTKEDLWERNPEALKQAQEISVKYRRYADLI